MVAVPNAKHSSEQWRVHVNLQNGEKCQQPTQVKQNQATLMDTHTIPHQMRANAQLAPTWVAAKLRSPGLTTMPRERHATSHPRYITSNFSVRQEINSDTTHLAPPCHGQTSRWNLRRLLSRSKTCCRHKILLPQPHIYFLIF